MKIRHLESIDSAEEGSIRATKALYICFAIATIVAMAISLAYPVWFLSQLTASPYNNVSNSNPALGIRLDLSVNSTSLKPGDTIAITISENNLRPIPNEVRAASDWKLQGLSLGPCGTVNRPIGFAIFKGNYTKENLSARHPLQLYQPGTYFCPMILSGINSYVFEPLSNLADVVVGSCTTNPCFKLQIEEQTQVAGSWSEPTLPFPGLATFHQFSPGVYTVAGGDEWGDLLVVNFTVSGPGGQGHKCDNRDHNPGHPEPLLASTARADHGSKCCLSQQLSNIAPERILDGTCPGFRGSELNPYKAFNRS